VRRKGREWEDNRGSKLAQSILHHVWNHHNEIPSYILMYVNSKIKLKINK
jgi:hypothetical protein